MYKFINLNKFHII